MPDKSVIRKEKENKMKTMNLLVLTFMAVLCSLVNAEEKDNLPVKVYVLVGQSNMQGKGGIEGEGSNTLRHMVQNDPDKEYQFLVEKDGSWRERSDV